MGSAPYNMLAEHYEKIENSTKRLDKTDIIATLLSGLGAEDKEKTILLLQGRVFPEWDERKTGVSDKIVGKALSLATGKSPDGISKDLRTSGDLGKTAEELIAKKKQNTLFASELTIEKVFKNIEKLSSIEGSGTVSSKVQLVAELLTSAKPIEARYITRTVLGDLRIGASYSTIRDALISLHFPVEYQERDKEPQRYKTLLDKIQRAYDLTNDLAEVARLISEKGMDAIQDIKMQTMRPVNPMLFFKADTIEKGFATVGSPAYIEYKYDGFRVQAHKRGDEVKLFTRRLEDVSRQFPELIERIRLDVKAEEAILDCEVLGVDRKTEKLLPFQSISQRIRRKHGIDKMSKEMPVVLVVFDVLKEEGNDLLDEGFEQRRERLERIVDVKKGFIELAESVKAGSVEEANSFYEKALLEGHEGMMMKSPDKGYKPGARIGYAVKIKPVLEPLDLVITRAEWGHGKRTGWLTSYTVSCKQGDDFLEVGKVGTGIKELEREGVLTFKELTELIRPLVREEHNSFVEIKPEIIVEVDYEEVQSSSSYASGFALRFPRMKRLREDIREPSSLDDVKRIYKEQRGRD